MTFTITPPFSDPFTEEKSVSYYDEDEGTVYSIKRKGELARVAANLTPEGYAIYNIYVMGDVQRQHEHPHGVKPEAWTVEDEVGRGKAKVWAAPMREDELARAARFRLHLPEEASQFRDWTRERLLESCSAWDTPKDQLQGLRLEDYFEPYLGDKFLFNSADQHEITNTPGPSNVIVRPDDKAREIYRDVRDEVLSTEAA